MTSPDPAPAPAPDADPRPAPRRTLTKEQGKLLVLSVGTIVCLYFSFRLTQPFLPAIVWAVAGAVVTNPWLRWLGRRIDSSSWRAAAAVGIVGIGLFIPALFLIYLATIQIGAAVDQWQSNDYLARLQTTLDKYPRLAAAWSRISENLDFSAALQQLAGQVQRAVAAVVSGSAYTLIQVLIALFILYFLYRDEDKSLAAVHRLSPLTQRETDRLLQLLGDTIHATIFGTLLVALIQGVLGGLVFWLLGLPGPVLWGTVMGLLAIIPYLGAFVIWAPAAVLLLADGHWIKALALVAWGLVVIGLIDNLLYPMFVGNRLRQHTVVAFIAILGGIAVFGASGIILGPVVVSLTLFLLEIWRHRTGRAQAPSSP